MAALVFNLTLSEETSLVHNGQELRESCRECQGRTRTSMTFTQPHPGIAKLSLDPLRVKGHDNLSSGRQHLLVWTGALVFI